MIANIKAYALIGLSIALAVMYALFSKEKAARYKDKAKVAHIAAKAMSEANKAIKEAEIKGKEKLCAKDTDRSHFSD